ncbi:phage holin family protein [Actinorugispora endophytica]|uniref:phage holin family protein n=1 Tax=Actinorugispora endophytica TaxID=1605990 RepID=UPI001FB7C821|nr:phage holin family protein [Actinorugispora endophytica]
MSETKTGGGEPVDFGATERSLGDLTAEVTGNLSQLVSLQIELAQVELAADVRRVAKGTGLLVVAALIAHLILILASVTIAFGLVAGGLPEWAAFLIVTGFYTLVAVVLGFFGIRSYKAIQRMPRTRESLARTKAVLRREHAAEL